MSKILFLKQISEFCQEGRLPKIKHHDELRFWLNTEKLWFIAPKYINFVSLCVQHVYVPLEDNFCVKKIVSKHKNIWSRLFLCHVSSQLSLIEYKYVSTTNEKYLIQILISRNFLYRYSRANTLRSFSRSNIEKSAFFSKLWF